MYLLIALLIVCAPAQTVTTPQAPAKKPSLDLLLKRVDAFWSALAEGKRLPALEYVEASGREVFLAWQVPAFSDPRVVKLEPAQDGLAVMVTMEVTRSLPPLVAPVTWPVTHQWVFRERNWFIVIERGVPMFATSAAKPDKPPLTQAEIEGRIKTVRELLHFEKTDLDFGTVRQGKSARLSIAYHLAGDQAMDLMFKNAPPELYVRGLEKRKFEPGVDRRIEFEFSTEILAGKLERSFAILVRYNGIEVPFEFKIRADVYAPVAAVPPILRFQKDEREKEIVLSNNSKSEVQIKSMDCENNEFSVQPIPLSLPPGGSARVAVKLLFPIQKRNFRDSISFNFLKPVEDMEYLPLPVIINPEEPKPLDFQNLTPQQIEELIRKSRPSGKIKP
jgi:hypothetical protein